MSWKLILNGMLLVITILFSVYVASSYYSKKTEYVTKSYSSVNVFTNLITDNIPKQLINDGSVVNDVLCYSEQGDYIILRKNI